MKVELVCVPLLLKALLIIKAELQPSSSSNDSANLPVGTRMLDAIEAFKNKYPRIVGGEEATKNGFPSIVSMYFNGHQVCAGTIVHEEWVLSAQHCLISSRAKKYYFIAGDHDLSVIGTTEQNVSGVAITKHYGYNKSNHHNDMVLFKIKPPFKFNQFVDMAVLPPKELDLTGTVTAVGWGRTVENGAPTNVLQMVDISVISREVCEANYKQTMFEGFLCAGVPEGGKDTCKGDSGGPLYQIKDKIQMVVGVTSWGYGCARPGNPGVYSRVSYYMDWINENACTPDVARRSIGGRKGKRNSSHSVGRNLSGRKDRKKNSSTVKLASILAESICNQHQEFLRDRKISEVVKFMPASNIPAGSFTRRHCGGNSCKPFTLVAQ